MKHSLNVAVIGTGYMGENHTRVYSSMPDVNIVAVCDTEKKRVDKISNQYKIKAYYDFSKLLKNEKIDAVSICLPTSLHFKAAQEAIMNNIVVFLEKPICAKVAEALKLIKIAKSKNVPIMVGHIERFNPVVNEIKHRIKSGELGKIIMIHTQRFSPPPARAQDVSAIVDLATHDIDILNYLLDQKPIRIYSETENKYHKKEDIMAALLRFKSGTIGLVEVSWLHPAKIRSLTVLGENGMYVANYLSQELFFYRQNDELFKNDNFLVPGYTPADVIKIAFESKEPLQIELQAFVNSLKNGRQMPVTAEDGLIALELAQKMIASGHKYKIIK